MDTLIKADIFFFISSIASVVLAVLFSIVLFYFIKAGRNLYLISEKLQAHFKESEEFVLDLKERLEENIIFRLFFPPARNRKRTEKKDTKHT
jgi:biopolymer transport protein ExbB/TolQ